MALIQGSPRAHDCQPFLAEPLSALEAEEQPESPALPPGVGTEPRGCPAWCDAASVGVGEVSRGAGLWAPPSHPYAPARRSAPCGLGLAAAHFTHFLARSLWAGSCPQEVEGQEPVRERGSCGARVPRVTPGRPLATNVH